MVRGRKGRGDPQSLGGPLQAFLASRLRAKHEAQAVAGVGWRSADELRRPDLQELADGLLAAGLDPSTIRSTFLPLRAIYRHALARGEVAVSPCTGLSLPAVRGRRERFASPQEAEAPDRRRPRAGPGRVGDRHVCRAASRRASRPSGPGAGPRGRRDPRRARLRRGRGRDRVEVGCRSAQGADPRRAARLPHRAPSAQRSAMAPSDASARPANRPSTGRSSRRGRTRPGAKLGSSGSPRTNAGTRSPR